MEVFIGLLHDWEVSEKANLVNEIGEWTNLHLFFDDREYGKSINTFIINFHIFQEKNID